MVSAIGPKAPRIKYPNRSGLGTRGNKQRLMKDVTPLPHLEDLRQGLGMPGHASCSTLGYPPGTPDSTSLRNMLARVPFRADPSLVTCLRARHNINSNCVSGIKGTLRYHPRWIPPDEVLHDDVVIGGGVGGITLAYHDRLTNPQGYHRKCCRGITLGTR